MQALAGSIRTTLGKEYKTFGELELMEEIGCGLCLGILKEIDFEFSHIVQMPARLRPAWTSQAQFPFSDRT